MAPTGATTAGTPATTPPIHPASDLERTMTPARIPAIALPLVLVAALAAGCGIADPYDKADAAPAQTAAAPSATAAVPAPTAPPAAPPATRAAVPTAKRPEAVIRRFAKTYMNWTFDELADTRR